MIKTNSKEVKIGLTFAISIAILFFGLNFLKGINIFSASNKYYAMYQDIGGLVVSNAVNIKGYKVGQVSNIEYNFTSATPFVVELTVNKDIKLPKGSVLVLADDGLMGGKIIDIRLGNSSEYIVATDTIDTEVSANILSELGGFVPRISKIIDNLDSITTNVNSLLLDPNIKKSLASLSGTMDNLNATMNQLKQSTSTLPATMSHLNSIAANLDTKMEQLDINAIMRQINGTLADIENFTKKLNNTNSSLGLLLNERTVYDNLNTTIQSANNLLIDLKANPKRYVNISVFGGKK